MNDKNISFAFEEKQPFYKNSKFYLFAIFSVIVVVIMIFFVRSTIKESWKEQELLAALKINLEDSFWVKKQGLHNETIIVPAISFSVKNISNRPLAYVSFNAIFFFNDSKEDLGDGFQISFKKPLQPGQTSNPILIKSSFGYKASSLQAFFKNRLNWKSVSARLFARVGNTSYVLLGTYPVKQEVLGVKVTYENPSGGDKNQLQD